jgi:hypothetical protein
MSTLCYITCPAIPGIPSASGDGFQCSQWSGASELAPYELAQLVVLFVVVGLLLWYVAYPWASLQLPFDQPGRG